MKNKKTSQEDIDYILDNFDFEKVKKIMDCLEWHWFSLDAIPSIGELRKCARGLLQDSLFRGIESKKDVETSTGGFKANYYREEDLLELSFIIEELDNGVLLTERIKNK